MKKPAQKKPVTIKVTAKITAGVHPVHGPIVKGQEYTINENDFGEQLFNRPEGWTPPWEREKPAAEDKTSKGRK